MSSLLTENAYWHIQTLIPLRSVLLLGTTASLHRMTGLPTTGTRHLSFQEIYLHGHIPLVDDLPELYFGLYNIHFFFKLLRQTIPDRPDQNASVHPALFKSRSTWPLNDITFMSPVPTGKQRILPNSNSASQASMPELKCFFRRSYRATSSTWSSTDPAIALGLFA